MTRLILTLILPLALSACDEDSNPGPEAVPESARPFITKVVDKTEAGFRVTALESAPLAVDSGAQSVTVSYQLFLFPDRQAVLLTNRRSVRGGLIDETSVGMDSRWTLTADGQIEIQKLGLARIFSETEVEVQVEGLEGVPDGRLRLTFREVFVSSSTKIADWLK